LDNEHPDGAPSPDLQRLCDALPEASGIGAQLVVDLQPGDRGPQGTHEGAVICNGNLYCPATPKTLLQLTPPPPAAEPADVAAHD
jgi:hypothetical protein